MMREGQKELKRMTETGTAFKFKQNYKTKLLLLHLELNKNGLIEKKPRKI